MHYYSRKKNSTLTSCESLLHAKCDETRNKGISIRFPRLLRVRLDKSAEEATSAAQILQFYFSQDLVISSKKTPGSDDEFEF